MPEKKVEKQKTDQEKKQKTVIYIGPAIIGVAMSGTVYNNGLPKPLEEAAKELPALKRLLVEPKNAGQAKKELKNPQSAVSVCYKNAAEYARKRGAER